MKRLLFAVLAFLLICSYASADTLPSYSWTDAYTSVISIDSQYSVCSENQSIIDTLKSYYEENLSSSYSYYAISCSSGNGNTEITLSFTNNNTVKAFKYDGVMRYAFHWDGHYAYQTYPTSNYSLSYTNDPYNKYNSINTFNAGGVPLYETNLDFAYSSSSIGSDYESSEFTYYEEIIYPSYTSANFSLTSFSIFDNNPVPTIKKLYDDTYDSTPIIGYSEVNLNDYAYVALSLKDYSVTEPFSTLFYVKGQLCLTPVYNYGMKEKVDYYPSYQVQGCSPYYDDFTPTPVSILQDDLQYHAIYYLKAFNTNLDNIVRFNNSIFNVTPITFENANNPYVTIGGRTYPTIPYDSLTSSSTKSEDEGYISGQVQNVFDVTSDSSFIDGLFSNPLGTLTDVWASVIALFSLIAAFIGLLPTPLQAFLYTALALGLSIGLIKIIL